jgi:hypothetical protein
MDLGFIIFERLTKRLSIVERSTQKPLISVVVVIILIFWFPAAAMVSRIVSTILSVIRHPVLTLKAIPVNWSRVTLCQDLFSLPEIVPGYEHLGYRDDLKLSWIFADFRKCFDSKKWNELSFLTIGLIIFGPLFYVPSIAYRWSLKATALIYTPLLWTALSTFRAFPAIPVALHRLRSNDIAKITLIYSILVIVVFILKWIMMSNMNALVEWFNKSEISRFLAIYVIPAQIPIWQIAAFVNALLAIAFFLFLGAMLQRVGHPDAWPDESIEGTIRSFVFVRTVLTLYTITCTLYITLQKATTWNWPPLDARLFPWM